MAKLRLLKSRKSLPYAREEGRRHEGEEEQTIEREQDGEEMFFFFSLEAQMNNRSERERACKGLRRGFTGDFISNRINIACSLLDILLFL
jgi:hypothetical protein